jgi:hypothetical protein
MITRMQMPRQLRDKGGIASVTPREKYGLGSKLKERFRKLIPNELADVAVKAAPFVAPFNPGIAGLMRGIGRFDQRGSISDALKQGVATAAFGAGTRFLGGADQVMGGGLRGGFTSPLSQERTQAIESLFEKQKVDPSKAKKDTSGILPKKVVEATTGKIPGVRALPKIVQEQLLTGGITAGASLLASYFQGDFREQESGETMEEYLAARKDAVGKQMRIYMDNYYANDPEYSALDDAGRNAFVARYNVRDGGMPMGIMRTNKAGVMERDYRDEGGFVPVGIKEKADDVPAMLSKNEFVFTADAVRGAGNGSIEKGAQKMYDTMKNLENRVS